MSEVLGHSEVALVKANKSQKPLVLTDNAATELRMKAIAQHLIDEAAMITLQTVMANVTAVIYNEDDYSEKDTGINFSHIGSIKVVPSVDSFPIKNIWIKPLDSQVRSYPIVGEMVNIINYGEHTFYFQPINFTNSVAHNIYSGFQGDGTTPVATPNMEVLDDLLHGFVSTVNPRPVKQYPGDWALNGRNDQSIRLGIDYPSAGARANKNLNASNAVIKMRISDVSSANVAPAGTTRVEDIDTDLASFYMTRDEEVNYTIAPRVDEITHLEDPSGPDEKIGGAIIILDSEKIVFNTKESKKRGQINIFAGNTVNIVSKKNTNIVGEMVKLGDSNDDNLQSAVLGENLVTFLHNLIQRLDNLAKDLGNVTGIGNVGGIVPIPAAMAAGSKLGGWTSAWSKDIIKNHLLSRNIKVSKKKRPNL